MEELAPIVRVAHLADTFRGACMTAFPDDKILDAQAKFMAFEEQPASPAPPGTKPVERSWIKVSPGEIIFLTLRHGARQSCEVSTQFPVEPDLGIITLYLSNWATTHQPPANLVVEPSGNMETATGRSDIYPFVVTTSSGAETDRFTETVSHSKTDGIVTVRLVRSRKQEMPAPSY